MIRIAVISDISGNRDIVVDALRSCASSGVSIVGLDAFDSENNEHYDIAISDSLTIFTQSKLEISPIFPERSGGAIFFPSGRNKHVDNWLSREKNAQHLLTAWSLLFKLRRKLV